MKVQTIAEARREARNAQREAELARARAARAEAALASVSKREQADREWVELERQLASGETCVRIAARERGTTPAELKAQLYGRAPRTTTTSPAGAVATRNERP